MPVTYPLDYSGTAPTNLVQNELHTVTEAHFRDYYFIVPNFAPFYVDNFALTITVNNVTTTLVEDVDFSFALPYVTGTRVTGKAMYGAVTLHNLDLNGILSMTYQTIGGDIVADRLQVLTDLADRAYSPRLSTFDTLINSPAAFPPSPHYNDYDNFYGQEELVNKLNEIKDAILANSSLTQNEIHQFLNTINTGNFSEYVKKAGDTMTGSLTLSGDPTDNLHAATKQYVDNISINNSQLSNLLSSYATISYVDNQDNTKVNKTGDTLTGALVLAGPPTQPLHPATKQYVDSINSNLQGQINTLQNDVNNLITNSATKQYVDDKINDLIAYIQSIVLK